MKTYNQFIQELFDRPYSFTMTKNYDIEVHYEFYTNDNKKYIVFMTYYELEDYWEITFANEKGDIEITGKGGKEVSSILATVIAIIKDFTKNKSPDKLYFSADKGEKSRVRLYTRLIKSQTVPGYKWSIEDSQHITEFILEKK